MYLCIDSPSILCVWLVVQEALTLWSITIRNFNMAECLEVSCAGIQADFFAGILILPFNSLLKNKLLGLLGSPTFLQAYLSYLPYPNRLKNPFKIIITFCPCFCYCSDVVQWERQGDRESSWPVCKDQLSGIRALWFWKSCNVASSAVKQGWW